MDTEELSIIKKRRNKFFIIALLMLVILAIITTIQDVLDRNYSDSVFAGILCIPIMPGFIIYVFTTGDIHGWQPGPIGQVGRIAVCTFGSWIFWTPIIWWIYLKKQKNKTP